MNSSHALPYFMSSQQWHNNQPKHYANNYKNIFWSSCCISRTNRRPRSWCWLSFKRQKLLLKVRSILIQNCNGFVRVRFISFQLAPVQETAQLTQAEQCILLEWCEIPKASMRGVCTILLKNLKEEERPSWNISMRLQRELHNNPLKVTWQEQVWS